MTKESITSIFSKSENERSLDDFEILYNCLGFIHKSGAQNHHVQMSFILLMDLAYQDNANQMNVSKRWTSLKTGLV